MVEPVVVIPDTDSNRASVTDSSRLEKYRGRAPNSPIKTQAPLVSRNASFSPRSVSAGRLKDSHRQTPQKLVTRAATPKACQFGSPASKSKLIGASMAPPSTASKIPRMFRTGAACIVFIPPDMASARQRDNKALYPAPI